MLEFSFNANFRETHIVTQRIICHSDYFFSESIENNMVSSRAPSALLYNSRKTLLNVKSEHADIKHFKKMV